MSGFDFRRAPISKCIAYGLAAATALCAWVPSVGEALALSSAAQVLNLARPQLWRLVTSLLFSDSLGSCAATCFLLYRFRVFERQMSSSKYGAFVVMSSLVAVMSRAGLVALPGVAGTGLASGPFHLVFGLLPLYYRTVPKLQSEYFRVLGFRASDKSLAYGIALALAVSDGPASFLPALAGLLFGLFEEESTEALRAVGGDVEDAVAVLLNR